MSFSLDAFFSKGAYSLSEERAEQYMRMAAELSLISRFKDDAELLKSRSDFQAALTFIKKLEEVEMPEGTEPLANVLEFYGGNQEKLRREAQTDEVDFPVEVKRLNRNMQGSLVKTPKPFDRS